MELPRRPVLFFGGQVSCRKSLVGGHLLRAELPKLGLFYKKQVVYVRKPNLANIRFLHHITGFIR